MYLYKPQCPFLPPTGGADDTQKAHRENKLLPMLQAGAHNYEYDLIVIGGGSGGLAAAKVRSGHAVFRVRCSLCLELFFNLS